uniref:Laminin, gamma 2 n=1 Tax=Amphiprion ocellaris TaxID=80972 RepID=A0AAQ5XJP8_AMPOC
EPRRWLGRATVRCDCNGRSRYCLRDAWGLHCLDCQGNYEGRHCERCKDGFYEEEAGPSCSPCHCNPTGSVSATCDSRGRCSCKEGVTGEKCDRCPDGPIGPNGCSQSLGSGFTPFVVFFSRQLREDAGSLTLPCFCSGHSNVCSPQSGYSVHNIISTFADGPEGWKAATVNGFTPDDVHFRWSPKHQDLEVISRNSLPVYLYAPEPYLGNQLLSYGQNLSFSLRLDRGVRHPSTNDVVLEGGGLRVAASLGDLRSIVPCGQKIKYSFRLDEQPDSRWRPQISSFQFQKLLQNLTAIKIRTTFGETGRGYLDNVQLVSARPSDGVPARWVQACSCPPGYDGLFCERCAAGFRRRSPAEGAFGRCERCSCTGGSCDPQTGDCYSADETPAERSCSEGFYRDPWNLDRCVQCPCPDGLSCSVPAGSLEPRCDRCPPGTTGPRCDSCQEGFHGDPAGVAGVQRPCRPCSCNGHIDVSVAGSCDRITGECLKCVNNTRGQSCEFCERGFYHSRPSDACKSCNCDFRGSESDHCDDSGRCQCRSGFEGLRCQRSNCPACFGPIKVKVRLWFSRFDLCLQELGKLVNRVNAAKDVTEDALQRINGNTNDLDNALNALRGFDRQIDSSKALADAAISRLPGINGTIQQAVRNNAETLSTLGDVSKDYNGALGAINMLDTLVKNLEVKHCCKHSKAGGNCSVKIKPKSLHGEIFHRPSFFFSTDQTVVVDEEDLKRLEDSLANAQRNVEGNLRPRLRDMEEKEEAQRRRLTGINQDIDTILADIANLEDILRAVPRGCYNSPPIEEA